MKSTLLNFFLLLLTAALGVTAVFLFIEQGERAEEHKYVSQNVQQQLARSDEIGRSITELNKEISSIRRELEAVAPQPPSDEYLKWERLNQIVEAALQEQTDE